MWGGPCIQQGGSRGQSKQNFHRDREMIKRGPQNRRPKGKFIRDVVFSRIKKWENFIENKHLPIFLNSSYHSCRFIQYEPLVEFPCHAIPTHASLRALLPLILVVLLLLLLPLRSFSPPIIFWICILWLPIWHFFGCAWRLRVCVRVCLWEREREHIKKRSIG